MSWAAFPVGSRVRCADPDAYIAEKARKLRNREGVVSALQPFSGKPIIDFPAVGRRKAYKWVPSRPSDLVLVADPAGNDHAAQ